MDGEINIFILIGSDSKSSAFRKLQKYGYLSNLKSPSFLLDPLTSYEFLKLAFFRTLDYFSSLL